MRLLLRLLFSLWLFTSFTSISNANQLVKCDFRKFRKSMQNTRPALVAQIPATMTPMPINAVQITDKTILRKIIVQGLFARRTEAGTIEVMARLVNCTDYPLQVEGRAWFMDIDQMPVEKKSAWRRVFLSPRSTAVYREYSIGTNDVSNYLVEIREGY